MLFFWKVAIGKHLLTNRPLNTSSEAETSCPLLKVNFFNQPSFTWPHTLVRAHTHSTVLDYCHYFSLSILNAQCACIDNKLRCSKLCCVKQFSVQKYRPRLPASSPQEAHSPIEPNEILHVSTVVSTCGYVKRRGRRSMQVSVLGVQL